MLDSWDVGNTIPWALGFLAFWLIGGALTLLLNAGWIATIVVFVTVGVWVYWALSDLFR